MENTNKNQNKPKQPVIIEKASKLAKDIDNKIGRFVVGSGYKSQQRQINKLKTSTSISENRKDAIRERLDKENDVLGAHFRLMSSPTDYTYSGDDAIEQMFDDRIFVEDYIHQGLLPTDASTFYTHISPKKLGSFRNSRLSRADLLNKIAEKEDPSTIEIILFFTLADAKELSSFEDGVVNEFIAEEIQKIKSKAANKNSTGIESERDRTEIEKILNLGNSLSLLINNAKKYYKESILEGLQPGDAPQKS